MATTSVIDRAARSREHRRRNGRHQLLPVGPVEARPSACLKPLSDPSNTLRSARKPVMIIRSWRGPR